MNGKIYTIKCEICGTQIVTNYFNRRCCSDECRREMRKRLYRENKEREKKTRICPICKGKFVVKTVTSPRKYCGHRCAEKAANQMNTIRYITSGKKPRPIVKVAGGVAMRKCLSCGKEFRSCWIGNRICDTCMKLTEMQYNESCY
jgi:hypothetical protein